MNTGYDDALTLACKAWLMCPRMTNGTMTIKLSKWYGRILADVIDFKEEKDGK